MQHTEKYKLNLIEPSDPFLPDSLNQNTQKVEDVLIDKMEGPVTELDHRVSVLEAHKFACGTYLGTRKEGSEIQFVPLPFTPRAVLTHMSPGSYSFSSQAFTVASDHVPENAALILVENGFHVRSDVNLHNVYYNFVAFA